VEVILQEVVLHTLVGLEQEAEALAAWATMQYSARSQLAQPKQDQEELAWATT